MSCIIIHSNIQFTPDEKKKFIELSEEAISKVFKKKSMMMVEIPPENQYGNAAGCVYFHFYAPNYQNEDQKRGLIKDLDAVVKQIVGERISNARACVIIKHHHGSDAGVNGVMHLDHGLY